MLSAAPHCACALAQSWLPHLPASLCLIELQGSCSCSSGLAPAWVRAQGWCPCCQPRTRASSRSGAATSSCRSACCRFPHAPLCTGAPSARRFDCDSGTLICDILQKDANGGHVPSIRKISTSASDTSLLPRRCTGALVCIQVWASKRTCRCDCDAALHEGAAVPLQGALATCFECPSVLTSAPSPLRPAPGWCGRVKARCWRERG